MDGSPKNRDQARPRLGIIHFLVWIFLNAVLFAINRSWIGGAVSKPWLFALLVVQVIQMATAVGGGPVPSLDASGGAHFSPGCFNKLQVAACIRKNEVDCLVICFFPRIVV
jgi:hypothetical protein